MASQGRWLFRWRSYLPFVAIAPFAYDLQFYRWPMSSHSLQVLWECVCIAIASGGLAVRCYVAGHAPHGTSGRNTRGQQAECLNTTGLYSITRNPLYLGNYFMWLGIVLLCPALCYILAFTLAFWLYYERIVLAEEEFLLDRFGDIYREWAGRTPAFWPDCRRWVSPGLPFSIKAMLRREYTGILGIGCGWTVVHTYAHWVVERRFVIELRLFLVCLTSLSVYVMLRAIKKHTGMLEASGR